MRSTKKMQALSQVLPTLFKVDRSFLDERLTVEKYKNLRDNLGDNLGDNLDNSYGIYYPVSQICRK